MALRSEWSSGKRQPPGIEQAKRQLLLIPEAPVLLALLLIGWAYGFPPAVGLLAALTVVFFLVRFTLLATAVQQLEQAHYSVADRLLEVSLRIYPWSIDALTLRAQGLLSQGDDSGAELLLRRAARVAPDSPAVHGALAGTLLLQGEYAEARAEAICMRELAAASPVATQHLAWLALHVDHEPAKALRLLMSIDVNKLPSNLATPMLVLLAEVQLANETNEAARKTMHRIEQLVSTCPLAQQAELFYQLGRLHALVGEDGGKYYRHSLNLNPQGRYAHTAWREMVDAGVSSR